MKILVTGASGFIGQNLVNELISRGYHVRALYRSEYMEHRGNSDRLELVRADVLDQDAMQKAVQGCHYIYHLAAYARVWARNSDIYRKTIRDATINLLELAIRNRVSGVLICSTAGVFGPSESDRAVTEETERSIAYFSPYEQFKDETDRIVREKYADRIHVVTVCPSRVFGPGRLSESNAVTKLIRAYSRGRFRFLPGNGRALGNYVFVSDVVSGMIAAMDKGRSGERYLLTGENVSYRDFFRQIASITGKSYRMLPVPAFMIIGFAKLLTIGADLFGFSPMLTPGWARKYLYNWACSNMKAREELFFRPRSLNAGLRSTLEWLQRKNQQAFSGHYFPETKGTE